MGRFLGETPILTCPIWGSKPEPPKIPSFQIQHGQERVQVDYLAAALERVVTVQQDVPPGGRRRDPDDQRHGLGIAAEGDERTFQVTVERLSYKCFPTGKE